MSSLRAGKNIFHSNVSNISEFGFWLIVDDKEYFIPFDKFPEFKSVPVNQIFSVKQLSPTQLYWEELDFDIELAALENPEHFPLIYSH